jgi:hypothetical protein
VLNVKPIESARRTAMLENAKDYKLKNKRAIKF